MYRGVNRDWDGIDTLVLENNDVAEFHDLNSSQVLRSLGLRASFVSGNQEESSVHNGGT
jgi:hypothetical protein